MYITIKGIGNTQELSEKLKGVCQIKKIKDKYLVLNYNNKNFVIKPDNNETSENTFKINLIVPTGFHILGVILGIILSFVTGLTGFIPMVIFIFVILLICQSIYKAVHKSELEKFVAFLENMTGEVEQPDKSNADVSLKREEVKRRVIDIICTQMNISKEIINENTSLHDVMIKADLLDWVEITMGLEKEFGIVFPSNETETAGKYTTEWLNINNSLREDNFSYSDIGTVKLFIDVVMELLQYKDDGSQSTDSETKEINN
jgi:acyl carrier protein